MTAPTTSQVHIDAAMTNVSIAYRNTNYIADQIFPIVPVMKKSDKFFTFDKADWFRNEAALRAPGTRGPVGEYSVSSDTYSCRPVAFGSLVPDEVVDNADSPLSPRIEKTEFCTDKVLLFAEVEVAAKVFGRSVWSGSATPSTTWDDPSSAPLTDVETARESIVSLIGREPNTMVIGRNVWTDLKNHPDLLDRIKFTQTGMMTPALLGQLFGVEKLLIGNAIYDTVAEGVTSSFSFVWGKHCWLGYVPSSPGLMTPAAGYLFTWKSRTVERYRMNVEKSDFIRAEWHYDDKATSADAGYLLVSAVA